MQLQQITAKPDAFLPSGVLIVEPHPGLLNVRTLLLAAARWPAAQIMIFDNAGLDTEDHRYGAAVARGQDGSGSYLHDGDVQPEIVESLPKRVPVESDPSHVPTRPPFERERPGNELPRRRDL